MNLQAMIGTYPVAAYMKSIDNELTDVSIELTDDCQYSYSHCLETFTHFKASAFDSKMHVCQHINTFVPV